MGPFALRHVAGRWDSCRVKSGMTVEGLLEAAGFRIAEAAQEVGDVHAFLAGGLKVEDAEGVFAAADFEVALAVGGDSAGRARIGLVAGNDVAVKDLDAEAGAVFLDEGGPGGGIRAQAADEQAGGAGAPRPVDVAVVAVELGRRIEGLVEGQ